MSYKLSWVAKLLLLWAGLYVFAVLLSGCEPLVSEAFDSSGCLFSTGGPIPGMASGVVVVCRSGRDKASVIYRDAERTVEIKH